MAFQGTVHPTSGFDAHHDAEALRKAMKGFGTDDKALIEIFGARTSEEMRLTAAEYKISYGRDLTEDIKDETSGHFEDALVSRLKSRAEYDAYCCHKAIAGAGTDEHCLVEILATRSNAEINALKEAYQSVHGKSLEKDIVNDTSGNFKRLLVSLVQGGRHEQEPVDMTEAQADARALYEAGEAHWGTDESMFNKILVTKSRAQIKAINGEYLKIKGQDLMLALNSEMSGHVKEGFKAIVQACINKEEYFADKLYHSMKGSGTDDRTLIRIVSSRCEIDMVQIKQEFAARHHKSLARFIEEDCSGDYKRLLMKLVGPN